MLSARAHALEQVMQHRAFAQRRIAHGRGCPNSALGDCAHQEAHAFGDARGGVVKEKEERPPEACALHQQQAERGGVGCRRTWFAHDEAHGLDHSERYERARRWHMAKRRHERSASLDVAQGIRLCVSCRTWLVVDMDVRLAAASHSKRDGHATPGRVRCPASRRGKWAGIVAHVHASAQAPARGTLARIRGSARL